MPASEYLETQVLTHLLRTGTWTKPAGCYLALLTALPTDPGGLVEVSAADYARLLQGPSDTAWIVRSSDNAVVNALAILWDETTNDWGTITGLALYDALTSGNLLAWSELASSRTVTSGGAAVIIRPGAAAFRLRS